MIFLRNTSIKRKLTLIIMLISLVSVLLTTGAITFIGYYNLRQKLGDELYFTAGNTMQRNQTFLEVDQTDGAVKNLAVFSDKPSISIVCLYKNNTATALYLKGVTLIEGAGDSAVVNAAAVQSGLSRCPMATTDAVNYDEYALHVSRVVTKQTFYGDDTFAVYIESDLSEIDLYFNKQLLIAFIVAVTVLLVSYLLALRLQRAISTPILHLADTARKVSVDKDYAVRASEELIGAGNTNNELVTLTSAFNSMLTEIEGRDQKLRTKNVELEKAKDEAEAANRAKSQFLANISHELRTPLNAIIGFSSIFMNQLFGPLGNGKYSEYAQDINESGIHLLDIINDILDLSKAEAGKLTLELEEVHIPKIIKKCITILSERAAEGSITITTDVPDNLPYVTVDRLRFIQIILNVVSNAVKFTEAGGRVHIEALIEPDYFVIKITDTGIGMAKGDIEKAFQSFGQIDSGLNRKYEGTGLGLPLTKRLVELHRGKIALESEPGKGTTVILKFHADAKSVAELKTQHKVA